MRHASVAMAGMLSAAALVASGAAAQASARQGTDAQEKPSRPGSRPAAGQPQVLTLGDLPWPSRLGARVVQVDVRLPLIDRVVLVPDAATFLAELSNWSPNGRWPVLLEDDRLAPMFIRRFRPEQVIRRERAGEAEAGGDAASRRAAVEAAVIHAWGGQPGSQTIASCFRAAGFVPPGAVVASIDDPAWTGAAALAAGRGELMIWIDDDLGRPDDEMGAEAHARLRHVIEERLDTSGYSRGQLGDEIEVITICRDVAGRVMLATGNGGAAEPAAITDVIGRHPGGERWAFCGWIFDRPQAGGAGHGGAGAGGAGARGDGRNGAHAAYVAMCSLFLDLEQVTLYNTYPTADVPWSLYGIEEAAASLREAGFTVETVSGDHAALRPWRRFIAGGLAADLFVMNTKGNADFFQMHDGLNTHPHDVPLLREPAAVHLIHSWSSIAPLSMSTVGGQWLDHGAYALVGSVHEPTLGAFVTPAALAQRLIGYVPLLVAARQWQGALGKPWKVQTFGDPLLLGRPPGQGRRTRFSVPARDGIDLKERAKELLRAVQSGTGGDARELLAEAARTVNLLGRDDLVLEVWRLAQERKVESAAARPALGALFRARQHEAFMAAWDHLPARDGEAVDMLWHLMVPRLGSNTEAEKAIALQLQATVREPHSEFDLGVLAPHLARLFGMAHARGVIERHMERAADNGSRRQLRALLDSL